MENILKETLDILNVEKIEEAAPLVEWGKVYIEKEAKDYLLPPDHNDQEAIAFLKAVVNNDENRGAIMLKDSTWLERILEWDEYEDEDGNEYSDCLGWEWVHCKPISPEWVPKFETYITPANK